ncbi:hypothetical protein AMJ48_00160 [Parcubacteria bacterium DG_74_1]|nr:MAG: hypothetical protein AMJ48_00160 [Parcubacteria bacterium DG_74_1]
MAVEIIPKPAEKTPFLANILLFVSIVLLLATVLSYFFLSTSVKETNQTIQRLKEDAVKEKTPQNLALIEEMLGQQKKIEDFSFLLDAHEAGSNIFDYLESISHPKVWFSGFSFSSNEKGATVVIGGQTDSFKSLGQQLLIFKEEKLIRDVTLSGVSFVRGKEIATQEVPIRFTFSLLLSPEIFIPLP